MKRLIFPYLHNECFLKQDYIIMLAFLNNVNIVEHLDLMLIGEQT